MPHVSMSWPVGIVPQAVGFDPRISHAGCPIGINHSGAAAATVGNIILGGGIGWAVDSVSGADNKYDSPVDINFVSNAQATAAAAVLPQTYAGNPTKP